MVFTDCKIKFQLEWTKNWILEYLALQWISCTAANQVSHFEKTVTKLYVPVVFLSIQDNTKLLKQSESGCKTTIVWNKYLPKMVGKKSKHLNVFIDPSFQGVNRLFLYDLKMLLGREITTNIIFQLQK